jgi:hypothetical protein
MSLSVYNFFPGLALRVVKTFTASGAEFKEGTILHFKERNFLPYHSGHTVYFEEATMWLCDLDETGAIVDNVGNEFFEVYIPDESQPIIDETSVIVENVGNEYLEQYVPGESQFVIEPPAAITAPIPVEPPPTPKMPHMRLDEMFTELRVMVAQTFRDADGREIPTNLAMRFLSNRYFPTDDGLTFVFVERKFRLEPGSPILENADNAFLRPVPSRDSLGGCIEAIYHQWDAGTSPELTDAVDRCCAWLNSPAPRAEAPQYSSENQPFRIAFLFEAIKVI